MFLGIFSEKKIYATRWKRFERGLGCLAGPKPPKTSKNLKNPILIQLLWEARPQQPWVLL